MLTESVIISMIENREAEIVLLQAELDSIDKAKIDSIIEGKRKASTILVRADGLSIVISKKDARHYERTISWYDGRKGEVIALNDRGTIRTWKIWLYNYVEGK